MRKQYTAPSLRTFSMGGDQPIMILAASLPKMEGNVVDKDGNNVDGTDWGYGGDGGEDITPEAKHFSGWTIDDEW